LSKSSIVKKKIELASKTGYGNKLVNVNVVRKGVLNGKTTGAATAELLETELEVL